MATAQQLFDERFAALGTQPAWTWCPRCDGCGWFEGGDVLQTYCPDCDGTGRINEGEVRRWLER